MSRCHWLFLVAALLALSASAQVQEEHTVQDLKVGHWVVFSGELTSKDHFMADEVEVVTRAAGEETAWRWRSSGRDAFTLVGQARALREIAESVPLLGQRVHYALFAFVGAEAFTRYEQMHVRRIAPVVGPGTV